MPASASAGRDLVVVDGRVLDCSSCARREIASSTSRGSRPLAARDGEAGRDPPLQAGDADHEELVEVAREDRQEAHPLEQRHARVLGELEDALVERQPRQLPVEEAVGSTPGGVRRRQVGRGGPPPRCSGHRRPRRADRGSRRGAGHASDGVTGSRTAHGVAREEHHVGVPPGEAEPAVHRPRRAVVALHVEHRLVQPPAAQVAQSRHA